MVTDDITTPLEKHLAEAPHHLSNLYICYSNMKDILAERFYPWVQSTCPYFTDHGELHVNSVIQTASKMLNKCLGSDEQTINYVESFLLLSAILWHDTAMVYGRCGHAIRVKDIIEEFKNIFPSEHFAQTVYDIVKAHSGKNGMDIPKREDHISHRHRTFQVFPRRLAAILRFADEISENCTRISYNIIDQVPNKNRIFWEYAHSVKSSRPETDTKQVVITYTIDKSLITKRFKCIEFPDRSNSRESISLIEYILCRLEKINNERIYCNRYSKTQIEFTEVRAEITITDGLERLSAYDGIPYTFRDGGLYNENEYPNTNIFNTFFKEHSQWHPNTLAKKLACHRK